jgi:hypothetical protein
MAPDAIKAIVVAVLNEQEERAAKREKALIEAAVVASLAAFGVDAEDKDELRELKLDTRHTRKWRKSVERIETVGWGTAVTVLVTGALGALWLGVQTYIKSKIG